jgi:phosphoglycerate dehydrogenase-like enzyme
MAALRAPSRLMPSLRGRNMIDWGSRCFPARALVKPTAFIVNMARGAIIDHDALADALEAGSIAGAGVDVFDPEPPTAALRLLRAPNVVLSPHVGGVTRETLIRIAMAAASNVRRFLEGQPLADVVSGATS